MFSSQIPTRDAGWSQYLIITVVARIELCTPPIARVARILNCANHETCNPSALFSLSLQPNLSQHPPLPRHPPQEIRQWELDIFTAVRVLTAGNTTMGIGHIHCR